MRAVVTKPFPGVRDGNTQPENLQPGDLIEGELAETALKYKLAAEEGSEEANAAGAGGGDQTVVEADGLVEIPDNWVKMKWFAMKALAEKILGKPVKGTDEAKSVIDAEVARRANPLPAADDGAGAAVTDDTKIDQGGEGGAQGAGDGKTGDGTDAAAKSDAAPVDGDAGTAKAG